MDAGFALQCFSRVGAALCELPLCIPHEPHVSGSRAGCREWQITHKGKQGVQQLLRYQLAEKTRLPRTPRLARRVLFRELSLGFVS